MSNDNKNCWYAAGLHFECLQCGNCCSGPTEGYIWVSGPEIRLIARHLNVSPGELKRKYLRRAGLRRSIIEDTRTHDCIFLQRGQKGKTCLIYPVRPTQCRTWPFWAGNLASPDDWNKTGQKCPGVNRGPLCSYEQIHAVKKGPKWWQNDKV